jgi:hypothetical protein
MISNGYGSAARCQIAGRPAISVHLRSVLSCDTLPPRLSPGRTADQRPGRMIAPDPPPFGAARSCQKANMESRARECPHFSVTVIDNGPSFEFGPAWCWRKGGPAASALAVQPPFSPSGPQGVGVAENHSIKRCAPFGRGFSPPSTRRLGHTAEPLKRNCSTKRRIFHRRAVAPGQWRPKHPAPESSSPPAYLQTSEPFPGHSADLVLTTKQLQRYSTDPPGLWAT